jgi:hypothetical protein
MSERTQCANRDKAGLPILPVRYAVLPKLVSASGTTSLLRGTISGYRKKRQVKVVLITPADRGTTGAAAILAALAGQGGAAVAGLNATNIREEADFVEFELNVQSVEGWLAFSTDSTPRRSCLYSSSCRWAGRASTRSIAITEWLSCMHTFGRHCKAKSPLCGRAYGGNGLPNFGGDYPSVAPKL